MTELTSSAGVRIVSLHDTTLDGQHSLQGVYLESDNGEVGVALVARDKELPRLVHWGRALAHPRHALHLYEAQRPQRVSGELDDTTWPSILPTQAEAWIGAKRLDIRRGTRELFLNFELQEITTTLIDPAKGDGLDAELDPGAAGGVQVNVIARDSAQNIAVNWRLQMLPGGLIRQSARLVNDEPVASGKPANNGTDNLEISKVELGWPLPSRASEVLTTTGHHLHERRAQRQKLGMSRIEKVAMAGRPDFDFSLLLAAGTPGFSFEEGEVYVEHLGWSGNSVMAAEKLPYCEPQISAGELLYGGEVSLEPGDTYATPWLYGSYGDGLNEASKRYHRFVRAAHPRFAQVQRPVLLNTWEAVYFEHSYATLAALADKAAEAGVERFVVDDGWFMHRRSDNAGLGDWSVDPAVWPEGEHSLQALADHVHAQGMQFGLWFEPEMINPDSDTAREHPEWILRASVGAPGAAGAGSFAAGTGAGVSGAGVVTGQPGSALGRLPMQGRNQQVIDLTNPAAYEHVFNAMDTLVSQLHIDYIKWDHNKLVTEPISPYSGRPAVHEQTRAVYSIFQGLKKNHPDLEIESCSSGGGRIDLGMLRFADRVWVSDCVDPVEREENQRWDSVIVPPEILGEHIGKSPADSTKRATSLSLRAAMAFFGHLGVEWNLLTVPAEQLKQLAVWVNAYKALRPLFSTGTVVHSGPDDSDEPAAYVDGVVAQDGSKAVYRFTQLTASRSYPAEPVRLLGLNPRSLYRVSLLPASVADMPDKGNGQSDLLWAVGGGAGEGASDDGESSSISSNLAASPVSPAFSGSVTLDGEALSRYGIRPPSLHPAQAVLFVVDEVEE